MLGIKRLYMFMLRSFVPLFIMTFFICLFIVLMQFLWKYIDEMVGKGLSVDVVAELFFYAALTMVPMALPLAILLASLMTFGNLGERFELTAMKASGVSLLKCMRPLIVFIALISVGAFFFQNNVLPVAQARMWTLLFSMRQKSPELEIPEGVFYDQIPGYNLFVQAKNRYSGTLYDLMIYDMSRGFDNASIILADSGRMAMMEDKQHLFLKLWQGESFENIRDVGSNMRNVPYRRESFDLKEILLAFDANFNRMDEEGMRNQYVGKNISQLQATIDSVGQRVDSIGRGYSDQVLTQSYVGVQYYSMQPTDKGIAVRTRIPGKKLAAKPVNIDSILRGANSSVAMGYINSALNQARRQRADYEFRGITMDEERKSIRRHAIELQKKFTLSFACLIFFFIGAPLGAIIRKGGLGMPLVVSVFLFIFYYIIDNTGYKMARDGKIPVLEGMWLSTAVLLPMGVFFTYKAMRDSAVFNKDAYVNFFKRLVGANEVRHVVMKEIVMDSVQPADAVARLDALCADAAKYLEDNPEKQSFSAYWLRGYSRSGLRRLSAELEDTVEYLSNSRDKLVINKLSDYPVLRSLWLYHPTNYVWAARVAMVLILVSVPVYLIGRRQQMILRNEISHIMTVSEEIKKLENDILLK
ncbi:MAG: LptF/LptG family permease [Muribaculaceae bacterium]|nr:LptF/LptG family permease [Muribaculaceae bacterium]